MKSAAQLGAVASLAVVAGLGHWLVDGRPSGDPVEAFRQEQEARETEPLRDGEVRLEDLDADDAGILWLDARSAEKWRSDGLKGSISVTSLSDDDLGTQLARYQNELFGARMLVIYCDDVNCSLSHELAESLKKEYADFLPPEVFVLHGGHVALRAGGRINGSNVEP